MSHVFPRHCHVQLPEVASASGCFLLDRAGKRYLDGSGGAAVSCLGHGDPEIISAVKNQLDQVAFAHTGFFTSEPAEKLADALVQLAPAGLERVYFVSGGSEAVEAAIKLARQFHLENGDSQRSRIISRRQSYHGNTLGALSAGGNQWRREPFAPLLIETDQVSPCYAYRGKSSDETDAAYVERLLQEFENAVQRAGADRVMAFIAEPVVGATLGAVPSLPGYFAGIRELCDRHGILMILDEVMCGMGRTGTLFACERDGVKPDIIVIAKGLGAGYQPIGALLCTDHIYQRLSGGSGYFQHGHTYLGHPVACAAGLAVLTAIQERNLVERCARQGSKLMSMLQEKFAEHPYVGDVRGRGLFLGLELVRDRTSREPFDPALGVHRKLKQKAFSEGLICYPMGGTVDGKNGDHVLLAPPFIINDNELEQLVDILATSINSVTEYKAAS